MGTAGIKKALIKEPKENVRKYGSGSIVELSPARNSFTAYLDKTCLGKGTRNPESTMKEVKWFLIREHIWTSFKQLYPNLGPNDFFTTIKAQNEENKDYKIFEGNNKVFTTGDIQSSAKSIGVIYLLIPYSNFPETDGTEAMRVVVIDKPQVLYCHFKFPKGGYIPLTNNEKKALYGQTVDVEVYTHMLPDWNNSLSKFIFDVELINKGKVVSKQQRIEITNPGPFVYNTVKSLKFQLNTEWQKNHNKEKKDEKFFLRLKGYVGFTGPVLLPKGFLTQEGEYDSEKDTSNWGRMEKGKWIFNTSPDLVVPYNDMSALFGEFEKQKNNQIQYIGDIEYLKKEYDPCGYSKITIADEDDKKRSPYVIFDEDAKDRIDNTRNTFDLVTGDKTKKKISITLDNLQNKNVLCTGVLLPKDQKHNIPQHVFLLDTVLVPHYVNKALSVKNDPTQANDTDAYADETKAPSGNVADVQGWKENEDYSFIGENKLQLNLSYIYNKTTAIGDKEFNDIPVAESWLVNYFWLSKEKIQTYFVPVSTCRYPNQLVKIRIFPDVEWSLNFLYNTSDPVWYGNSEPTYNIYGTESKATRDTISVGDLKTKGDVVALADLRREERNENKNIKDGQKKIATSANRYMGDMKGNFGLSAKVSYNGGVSHELSWKFAEKYRKMLGILKSVYDTVDDIAGAKEARKGAESLPPSLAGRRSMMSLSLLPPAPSAGISWKFAKTGDFVGLELAGKVKCSPLIGGELKIDLLALADKIPVYGKFITFLDLTTWLIEKISMNALSITYRIDLIFYANLAIEEAYVKWNDAKEGNKFDTDLTLSGTLGGKLELELGLTMSAKQINKFPEVELQAGVRADCSFKITASPNFDWDNKFDFTTKFSGLMVTVYYKFSMKRNSKNKAPETLDPFKLIPSYSGNPVSMTFGAGEEHKY